MRWKEGDTVFLSVAFTWRLEDAYARAQFARAEGFKVKAGGPALFLVQMRHRLADAAEIGADYPDDGLAIAEALQQLPPPTEDRPHHPPLALG